ncbi:flagellar filament outer layer protein FlaA [Candidatus Aerophobetes bacterium]|uniref:Flagellar filament outer layer protein FlaA n=1 Tax=Aerophobetes bacterium TaxID=2030807 RepID=A0A662D4V9_UNCAE|nr:MAG: flagellar filament outer layer protein FlaA [Candidatus Aerophobetes bacterium]
MKLKLLALGLIILIIPALGFGQYLGTFHDVRFKMEDIRSIILDDFENNDRNWQVSASRFTAEGFPQIKFGVEGVPIALQGAYQEGENKYVMGVRTAFTRKGYNRVWIYPEEEIVIPGRLKKIDVWVWGANYNYFLEIHLRDYTGVVHKLPMGSLKFIGWRNLSVEIPSYIPQYIRYLPMEKPLTFVRFVIWTAPTERVDDFYIYFDHLKILTDVYRERFDGDILADKTKDIWSSQ